MMVNTDPQGARRDPVSLLQPWRGPTSVTDTGMSVVFEPDGVPNVE